MTTKKEFNIENFEKTGNSKFSKHFSGASPPEIFIGRFNYPNVNAGILSSANLYVSESKDSELAVQEMSFPEIWHKKSFSIKDILMRRGKLIYGGFKIDIRKKGKFLNLMQELSMAYKPVSTEIFLKKIPDTNKIKGFGPIITNMAPLENAKFQEEPKVKPKVEHLVSDTDNKAVNSINELYLSKIPISDIIKILSAGLLGLKTQRKLVPTRWSITTVDDTISKQLFKKIRYYPEIDKILLFNSEYNGNYYEILLLPDKFSFEVIEVEIMNGKFLHDYEFFNGRKNYAYNVTGAYYACRLALCEYLERIKRQATAIFFREVRAEYYAPLGVGILRECCRNAFEKKPEIFNSIDEAFKIMQTRLRINVEIFKEKSVLLNEYGRQRKLGNWFCLNKF